MSESPPWSRHNASSLRFDYFVLGLNFENIDEEEAAQAAEEEAEKKAEVKHDTSALDLDEEKNVLDDFSIISALPSGMLIYKFQSIFTCS